MASEVDSNMFTIAIVRDTELGSKAASFRAGWSNPLSIPTLGQQQFDSWQSGYQSYPDEVNVIDDINGSIKTKRNWHWSSKWCWDPVTRRMMAIHSPHIETDNLNGTQLTVYDEGSNVIQTYQNPISRTVGHAFDCNAIDVANRKLYKWTQPRWLAAGVPEYIAPFDGTLTTAQGYQQPQLSVLDVDAITMARNSVENGAAQLTEIPRIADYNVSTDMRNVTAPGADYVPGLGYLMYHDKSLYLYPEDGSGWNIIRDQNLPVVKNDPTKVALHCILHHNPYAAGHQIFGGGSYAGMRQSAFWLRTFTGTITDLDNSPVNMSVNSDEDTETKCCATFVPGTPLSVFFHNNRNIYILDPTKASGQQWTTLTGEMDPDNPVNPGTGTINNDRWCCPIPEYNCIAVGHFGWYGTSQIRLWRY